MRSISYGRWRKSVSAVIATAMLLSLIVVPASGVPTASVPDTATLNAGTTGVTNILGTGALGINGRYLTDVEVTATKSTLTGSAAAGVSKDTTLGAIVPALVASLSVDVSGPNGTTSKVTVSGLTTATTVAQALSMFDASPKVDATISAGGDTTITCTMAGAYAIAWYDGSGDQNQIWGAILGGVGTLTHGSYTVGISSGYGANTATFTPDQGLPVMVDGLEWGIMEGATFAASKVETTTGVGTTIRFPVGHEYYAVAPAGLQTGTLVFDGKSGVRDAVTPTDWVGQEGSADKWQAGVEETLTVIVSPQGGVNAINGVKVGLPGGFEFKQPISAVVESGGSSYPASVTAESTTTILVDKFAPDGSNIELYVKIKNSKTTKDDGKKVSIQARNVGGSAWTALTVDQTLNVVPNKTAGALGIAEVDKINAGGQTFIDGVVYDIYGNADGYWEHSVQFGIQAPSSDATMVTQDIGFAAARSQIDTRTLNVLEDGQFDMWFQTAATSGVNTLTISVDHLNDAKQVIVIDTRTVGDPAKLVVYTTNDRYSFPDTDTAQVRVRVVDAAGNPTSYDFDNVVRLLGTTPGNVTILAKRADSGIIFIPGNTDPRVELLSAYDYTGYAAMADWVSIEFVDTSVFDDEVYEVLLSAQPDRALVDSFERQGSVWDMFHGDNPASFAYAKAGVGDSVEYTGQLVNQLGQPVALAGRAVTITVGPYDSNKTYPYPGELSTKTAVTDANGQFTFSVSSEVGNEERYVACYDEVDNEWWGSQWSYWTPIGVDVTCTAQPDGTPIVRDFDGYAHVFFSKVSYQSSSCEWEQTYNDALANGEDQVKFNFKYMWKFLCEPATGQEVNFTNTLGVLDPETAVVGDDGWAHVAITSDEAGDGTLYRFGPNGDFGALDYSFKDYKFVIDVLNELTPGGRNVQTGCDNNDNVYGDLLMRLVDKNNQTVYLASDNDGDPYGTFEEPSLNSCSRPFTLENVDWAYEVIDGKRVAVGYRFRIFNGCPKPKTVRMRDGYISGFVPASTYTSEFMAQNIDELCAPADCDFDFVNEAKLNCTIDFNKSMFGKIIGSGFPKFTLGNAGYDGSSGNFCVQYRRVGTQDTTEGKDGGNWYGLRQQIHFEPDGSVNDWIVGTIYDNTYCGNPDAWLPEGVYDLKVQGNVFPAALTVIGQGPGKYNITTPGIAEGQVFYPGKLTQSAIAVNGEAALPLDWCAVYVDGAKIGDSDENVPYSTTFSGLDFSYLQPGRHTFTVQYDSIERYQGISNDYWQQYSGLANINFYIKPKVSMTVKPSVAVPSYNTTFSINGTVVSLGSDVSGIPVTISQSANKVTWTKVADTTTNALGRFSVPTKATSLTYYKVEMAGNDSVRAATSVISVKPRAYLTTPIAPISARAGVNFTVYGKMLPKHAAPVYVNVYKKSGTRYVYVKRILASNAQLSTYTKYYKKIALPAGVYKFRALHSDTTHYATWTAYSRAITIR